MYVKEMLTASATIVDLLVDGHLVVIQSGGPDQRFLDSILACIVQMLLDPYYRTIDGFCTLLRKDWFFEGYEAVYIPVGMHARLICRTATLQMDAESNIASSLDVRAFLKTKNVDMDVGTEAHNKRTHFPCFFLMLCC